MSYCAASTNSNNNNNVLARAELPVKTSLFKTSLLFFLLRMNLGFLFLFETHDLPQADAAPTSFLVRSSFRL